MAVRPIDGTWSKFVWNLSESESLARKFRDGKACLIDLRLAVEAQPTLTPPNEWVSVEDRLPEVGQEVLVYWRNTSQKAEHFELTHYDGDHWFLLDNTERPWIVVVAWMPLPAPDLPESGRKGTPVVFGMERKRNTMRCLPPC